jgi:DNA replication protein DnaC
LRSIGASYAKKRACETVICANLFFQTGVTSLRAGSILITSNQSLTGWGQVFGDQVIATAILDRLLHYSTIINIKGESYRLKEEAQSWVADA